MCSVGVQEVVILMCVALCGCRATRPEKVALANVAPARDQSRDCAQAAKLIGALRDDDDESRDRIEAVRKVCVESPWPATVIDCAVHGPADANPYACTDQLPADQHEAFDNALREVNCKYNDCIPSNMRPPVGPP